MTKSVVNTPLAPAPIGPYNQAIKVDNTLYVSGQIAIIPESDEMAISNIEEETHRVMKNLGAILKEAGMDYTNIVKCSIFINNMDNFGKINEVYGGYLSEMPPARETVEVSRLPKNVNVEISCVAVI